MTYTLKNENLTVTINSLGAEVVSVKDKNGRELWWNGDPAFWKGHSPILFPACGGLWNGKYSLNGKEYNMPKHGFAKGMEFEIDKNSPVTDSDEVSEVSFTTTNNDETMLCFPFRWQLTLRYTLRGEQLECEAEVRNLSDETMHYQIGGHPALALPDFDTVEGDDANRIIGYMAPANMAASGPVNGVSVVRAGEQGCWSPERYHVQMNENGLIPICVDTFRNEALIFDGGQFYGMELYRADGETPLAQVYFDAPVCLVWQMTDLLCPYVCIEPWFGLCDRQGWSMPLDYRPFTQHTMAHEESNFFLWGIRFCLPS